MQKERVIIVVGGGLAGLSASIEAYRAGANVFLLDKELKLGGNSAKASSGINAVGTSAQREAHSKDNVNAFVKDILSVRTIIVSRILYHWSYQHYYSLIFFYFLFYFQSIAIYEDRYFQTLVLAVALL